MPTSSLNYPVKSFVFSRILKVLPNENNWRTSRQLHGVGRFLFRSRFREFRFKTRLHTAGDLEQ
jgi:hypothetical protein